MCVCVCVCVCVYFTLNDGCIVVDGFFMADLAAMIGRCGRCLLCGKVSGAAPPAPSVAGRPQQPLGRSSVALLLPIHH